MATRRQVLHVCAMAVDFAMRVGRDFNGNSSVRRPSDAQNPFDEPLELELIHCIVAAKCWTCVCRSTLVLQQSMSRFWAGASSDSDSEDSDASSVYSSEESANKPGNRWVAMSDSESSEDSVRVVKSGKERAYEQFQAAIAKLKGFMKERDYYAIQTEFDELAKAMIKAKQYLATGVPRPLVRILVELEDYITERLKDKEQFKSLSARQGRALNRMKLTLKKHNKAFQVVIDAYRQNPDAADAESSASSKKSSSSESSSSASSKSSKSSSSSSSSSKAKVRFHLRAVACLSTGMTIQVPSCEP